MPYIYKTGANFSFSLKGKDQGYGAHCESLAIDKAVELMRHLTKNYCMVYPIFLTKDYPPECKARSFPESAQPLTEEETELVRYEWGLQAERNPRRG